MNQAIYLINFIHFIQLKIFEVLRNVTWRTETRIKSTQNRWASLYSIYIEFRPHKDPMMRIFRDHNSNTNVKQFCSSSQLYNYLCVRLFYKLIKILNFLRKLFKALNSKEPVVYIKQNVMKNAIYLLQYCGHKLNQNKVLNIFFILMHLACSLSQSVTIQGGNRVLICRYVAYEGISYG